MKKGIIFDMDGTIVDSLPYHYEAWKIFFKENKVENFSEKLKDYKGGGTLDLLTTVLGNNYSKKETYFEAKSRALKLASKTSKILYKPNLFLKIQSLSCRS